MINIINDDVFNNITLFLLDYQDLLSLIFVNKYTYNHNYENKEVIMNSYNKLKINSIRKITMNNMVVSSIPYFIKKIIFNECTFINRLDIDNISAIHIQDCLSYNDQLNFINYKFLKAVYLYNFTIDPDDFELPNLEYLFIYESDDDYSYVCLFKIS